MYYIIKCDHSSNNFKNAKINTISMLGKRYHLGIALLQKQATESDMPGNMEGQLQRLGTESLTFP
jgi:hypothetical protein